MMTSRASAGRSFERRLYRGFITSRTARYTSLGILRVHLALMKRRERNALLQEFIIATEALICFDDIAPIAQALGLFSSLTPRIQVARRLWEIHDAMGRDPRFQSRLLYPSGGRLLKS